MEVLKDFNYAAYTANATIANLWVVTFAVVMNKQKWESLPADVKKVFDDLRTEQALWTGKYVDDHVLESLSGPKRNTTCKSLSSRPMRKQKSPKYWPHHFRLREKSDGCRAAGRSNC